MLNPIDSHWQCITKAGSKATDFASMELHEIYLRRCGRSDDQVQKLTMMAH